MTHIFYRKLDDITWLVGFALLTAMVAAVWIPGILLIGWLENSE